MGLDLALAIIYTILVLVGVPFAALVMGMIIEEWALQRKRNRRGLD